MTAKQKAVAAAKGWGILIAASAIEVPCLHHFGGLSWAWSIACSAVVVRAIVAVVFGLLSLVSIATAPKD